MKKITFLLLLLIIISGISAQDIITRRNGNQINCTITKVDSTTVYFNLNNGGDVITANIPRSEVKDIKYNTDKPLSIQKSETLPPFSLGFGIGNNHFTGLFGMSVSLRLDDKISAQIGSGVCLWGMRYSFGVLCKPHADKNWSYGIAYTINPGHNDFEAKMENSLGEEKTVKFNLLKVNTIDLTARYDWVFHKTNTFYIDFGYAIPLQSKKWEVTDGTILSSDSKEIMDLFSPGGVIWGLGLNIGL